MRRRTVLLAGTILLTILFAVAGGYVYWQYRTARPPALADLPIYSAQIAVPVTDLPEAQREKAEVELRDLASTVQNRYRIADTRLLVTKGPFIWDALRHKIGTDLASSGLGVAYNGLSTDHTKTYTLYQHDGWLQSQFNSDAILVVGYVKATVRTAGGDEIYLYGYFRLAPR